MFCMETALETADWTPVIPTFATVIAADGCATDVVIAFVIVFPRADWVLFELADVFGLLTACFAATALPSTDWVLFGPADLFGTLILC